MEGSPLAEPTAAVLIVAGQIMPFDAVRLARVGGRREAEGTWRRPRRRRDGVALVAELARQDLRDSKRGRRVGRFVTNAASEVEPHQARYVRRGRIRFAERSEAEE